MFTPENGAKYLWQWDMGQRLVCSDLPAGQQVHFAYKDDDRAIVVNAYEENDNVYADIPNELLRTYGGLLIYAYLTNDKSEYTQRCEMIHVNKRPMPEDYVHTPDDVRTYTKIERQIGDLNDLQTVAKDNVVSAINEVTKNTNGFVKVDTAKVGQIIRVKSIDETGRPVEWEAINVGGGLTVDESGLRLVQYTDVECDEDGYLKKVKIYGHETIKENAYYDEVVITDVYIDDANKVIGYEAFSGCSEMTNLRLSRNTTRITYDAFYNCEKLADVELPDTVEFIGEEAFYSCSKLRLVGDKLPLNLTYIDARAFMDCLNLRLTEIPDSVTYIGDQAFENCIPLNNITLPENLETLGSQVFNKCGELIEVTFTGKNIKSIAEDALAGNLIVTVNVPWAEGEVAGAPWGATNATIIYNHVELT